MASTKISALPAASALAGTEVVPVVQGGATAGATVTQIRASLLAAASNLSDLANAGTARANLGLGSAAVLTAGAASGVATLDGSGKLTAAQIPASLVGAVVYQGTWNANTNSPALASGTGTKGFYYRVSVAGTTSIDSIASWAVGDTIIFDGTVWSQIEGQSAVESVNGKTGPAVSLVPSDVGALAAASNLADIGSAATARSNIGVDKRTTFADANYTALATDKYVATTTTLTAPRTVTLPAASSVNPGQELTILDEAGAINGANTITIQRAGSDTIDGVNTEVIGAQYGGRRFYSDGVNKWSFDKGVLRAANNLSDLTSASTARTNLGLGTAATQASTSFAPAESVPAAVVVSTTSTKTVDWSTATYQLIEYTLNTGSITVTIATSNVGTASRGQRINLILNNTSGGTVTLAWPAWLAMAAALPTTLAAGKMLEVSVLCRGTTDANCNAAWTVQP